MFSRIQDPLPDAPLNISQRRLVLFRRKSNAIRVRDLWEWLAVYFLRQFHQCLMSRARQEATASHNTIVAGLHDSVRHWFPCVLEQVAIRALLTTGFGP